MESQSKILMGVDPGTLVTGYGILHFKKDTIKILKCDAIVCKGNSKLSERLGVIFKTLNSLIKKYQPDELVIETAFYGKNAQSALKLGHARGAVMLAGYLNSIPMTEYSPREVKKAVTGNGAASKIQVMRMVKSILSLKELPKYYDTTDALAVALCHSYKKFINVSNLNFRTQFFLNQKSKHRYKDWKHFIKEKQNSV